MSYLDDLKQNQLLQESFYYVPGPDNSDTQEAVAEEYTFTEADKNDLFEELSDVLDDQDIRDLIDEGGPATPGEIFRLVSGQQGAHQQGLAQGAGAALATAAVLAAAIAGGVAAYKRFFSKAAKACKGKSGNEKTSCMNKFKRQAQQAKVSAMVSAKSKCAKSKDPSSCKIKLDKKIAKEKAKMGDL